MIDLFAGCGGMTRGFVDSGRFEPTFAVEMDQDAAETYATNFGRHVFAGPIENVKKVPKADVVIGGPPCQGFSLLNRNGVGLERRRLWRHYLRVLLAAEADAFVMENVPQLLSAPEFLEFKAAAEKAGFAVEGRVLLAADYGVPQLRKRAIAVGIRNGEPTFPVATHGDPSKPLRGLEPWRTFRWASQNPSPLPLEPDGVAWHSSRNPRPVSVERYMAIPNEGEGRFELAERRPDITPRCWLNKPTGTTDVFGRLWWDRPAYTIRTEFFKPEKGRYLHPSEHRPITLREAARLMSFPDDFEFSMEQSMTSVGRQIGNAVPCLLARRIAESVAASLDLVSRDRAARTSALAQAA